MGSLSFKNKAAWFLGVITILLITVITFGALTTRSTAKKDEEVGAKFSDYVDGKGAITLPTSYREEWSHIGSWVVPDERAPGYGFHDVYTQQNTVDAYKKTGKFPDGAVLVKEIRTIKSGPLTTGPKVEWAGDNAVWFVMVKDEKGRFAGNLNWGDGWGWALYKADDPSKNVSTDYKKDCIGCHVPAKQTDWVYIQGYPNLRK